MDNRRIALLAAAVAFAGILDQSGFAQARTSPAALVAGNGSIVSPTPHRFADLVWRLFACGHQPCFNRDNPPSLTPMSISKRPSGSFTRRKIKSNMHGAPESGEQGI